MKRELARASARFAPPTGKDRLRCLLEWSEAYRGVVLANATRVPAPKPQACQESTCPVYGKAA